MGLSTVGIVEHVVIVAQEVLYLQMQLMAQKVPCYGTILILTIMVYEVTSKTLLTLECGTGCPSAEGSE